MKISFEFDFVMKLKTKVLMRASEANLVFALTLHFVEFPNHFIRELIASTHTIRL